MKIYTRTGDLGETALFAGGRVSKDHVRIESYGDIDELNASLGLVRCETLPAEIDELLGVIQHQLFDVGAELATPNAAAHGHNLIKSSQVERLEKAIDHFEAQLQPLKQFILPGGSRAASLLHVARNICRRAERRLVTLTRTPGEKVSNEVLAYVNRLSDLLFVLARAANSASGTPDVPWEKGKA